MPASAGPLAASADQHSAPPGRSVAPAGPPGASANPPGASANPSAAPAGYAAASADRDYALRRSRILRARRRMLGTLLVLVAGAAGLAVIHLAASWVVVPPAAMLAGFLVLLREAAHTDAERARRATSAARTVARETGSAIPAEAGPNAPAAGGDVTPAKAARPSAASWPEPTAQVIELSGRIHDQLYDQYSDAAERAVGD